MMIKIHREFLFYSYFSWILKILSFIDTFTIQKVTKIEYYVAFCTVKAKYSNTTNTKKFDIASKCITQPQKAALTFRKCKKQLSSQNVSLELLVPFKMQLVVKINIQIEQFYALAYKFVIPLQCNRKGN